MEVLDDVDAFNVLGFYDNMWESELPRLLRFGTGRRAGHVSLYFIQVISR